MTTAQVLPQTDKLISVVEVDKIGSATINLGLAKMVGVAPSLEPAQAGDCVIVRAITDNSNYNQLELTTGRLAKINPGDVIAGVLGRRRALKGFIGDIPAQVKTGDKLHILNLGGVIGISSGACRGLGSPIQVEVIGVAVDGNGDTLNIGSAENAIQPRNDLGDLNIPLVLVAGTCMNSGKTFASSELVKQFARHGQKVAGAKLSGVACLRDTLNMQDHGAVATASFVECGLPSTVGLDDLAPIAKGIISHLASVQPDVIVVELGDGILGGYSVESIFEDVELRNAMAALVFCASDFVGAWGGVELLRRKGVSVDVVAGSVTDTEMGVQYIENELGIRAANATHGGERLWELISSRVASWGQQ
ncbi:MAG TPA: hypothetical protein VFC63_00460 [Blastocatellia bacterium]|nr:hypothetical protein [Blastocatellia bacterium]